VVWTIKPAKASSEIDRMTNAISTSISENPFDFLERLKVSPPGFDFELMRCKTYTNRFGLGGRNFIAKLFNRLKRLEIESKS